VKQGNPGTEKAEIMLVREESGRYYLKRLMTARAKILKRLATCGGERGRFLTLGIITISNGGKILG